MGPALGETGLDDTEYELRPDLEQVFGEEPIVREFRREKGFAVGLESDHSIGAAICRMCSFCRGKLRQFSFPKVS